MNDFKTEIALEPEVPKVVIYYPADNGNKLISLIWAHGENAFTHQIGDEPPEWVPVPDRLNMYLVSAQMINWLDKWCEDNERGEWEE